ncbi:unnamed protein product [Trichobilharzia regenti]|nr:unnamed protein product [Trichobilharzia regenti]
MERLGEKEIGKVLVKRLMVEFDEQVSGNVGVPCREAGTGWRLVSVGGDADNSTKSLTPHVGRRVGAAVIDVSVHRECPRSQISEATTS